LIDKNRVKGNRDSIEGKQLTGLSDEFISGGGADKTYSPLFFRTFRYLQADIETRDESLTISDFHSIFTGYPFVENAYFKKRSCQPPENLASGLAHCQVMCCRYLFRLSLL